MGSTHRLRGVKYHSGCTKRKISAKVCQFCLFRVLDSVAILYNIIIYYIIYKQTVYSIHTVRAPWHRIRDAHSICIKKKYFNKSNIFDCLNGKFTFVNASKFLNFSYIFISSFGSSEAIFLLLTVLILNPISIWKYPYKICLSQF